ncbi:MAG: mannosyltransferase family protein, partial [Candidatus Dormibacterales bacterium]
MSPDPPGVTEAAAQNAWRPAGVLAQADRAVPALVAAAIAIVVEVFALWARALPLEFAHWDAIHYLFLAQYGYPSHLDPRDAFFPGYPMLVRAAMFIVPDPLKAALAVSAASAVVACWSVGKLVEEELGDRAAGSFAAWLLVFFPGAFFMFAPYSEAPFVASAALCAYLARRGGLGWATLAGTVACAVRPVGGALALVLLVEALRQRRWRAAALAGAVLLPILAFFAYLGLHAGDFWAYPHSEAGPSFGITFAWPWTAALASWNAGGPYLDSIYRPAVVLGLAGAAVTTVALVARRIPLSLGLYCAATVLVSLAESNWRSAVRYDLALFPLLIPIAAWTAGRVGTRTALLAAGASAFAFSAAVYAVGG